MKHSVDDGFVQVCRDIVAQKRTLAEWAEIESDDMFQTEKYVGGFDATEMQFCFSAYIDGREYWLQLSLDDVEEILAGNLTDYEIREADL